MHECLEAPLQRLLRRENLSTVEVQSCVGAIMDGACEAVDIAAFLTAMAAKGPVPDEIVGAARAMRERAAHIRTARSPLLDTCGTGGDRLHTFNISTATAIVAAACDINVAKHGNRSVSSSSGSADVLEFLGVRIDQSADAAGRCLDKIGIAFCFAPVVHGAMKHAAPVRRQLGFPTIFNLLGPLTNPAGAEHQLLGASSNDRGRLLSSAAAKLGTTRTLVVCGNDQLDEVCLWGPTAVFDVQNEEVSEYEVSAADFDLPECSVEDLVVSSASESAEVIQAVLSGRHIPDSSAGMLTGDRFGAASAIVIANTSAALVAAGRFDDFRRAAVFAKEMLVTGTAVRKLQELVEVSQSQGLSS
ncbi:MAG: anthranilate phosphoribosyltransferase [Planctomycetaceae bacterium]|nr:anthranilate phosphoribosyltransferase [Planctomycetaceae bacterium]